MQNLGMPKTKVKVYSFVLLRLKRLAAFLHHPIQGTVSLGELRMSSKVSRWFLPFLNFVLAVLIVLPSANAQSVPCAAITRNPLVLEALLDSHSNDAETGIEDDTLTAAGLAHLQFNPIVIQPGDALYVEYRGRDFTVNADFANGEMTAFDSSPKGSYEQWRKGVLPLDIFRGALNQRLVRLWATAKNPNQVLFRNIKIIRAGRPVFEFARLISYGKPQVKTAVERQLPCAGFDDVPANMASATVKYSFANPGPARNFSGGLVQPMSPFPMTMQSTGPTIDANHYKFTGKELDDETGLYNYGARYYSPSLGRFITPDWSARPTPIPYADLSNPQILNLYTYGHNNPTSLADLDGHDPGDKFKSKKAAAADAVGYIRKQPNGYKFEYGTRIFKDGKTYSYNDPVTQQNPKGVDLPELQKNDVGDVHTHNYGVGDDAHANSIEQPDRIGTVQDKDKVQKMQDDPKASVDYQSYVGAPNGDLLQFTPNPNAPDGLGDAKTVQHNVAPDPKPPAQQPPQPKKEEPR